MMKNNKIPKHILTLCLLALFLSISINFSIVLGLSLFLQNLSAAQLPYFYILLNVLSILCGFIFFFYRPKSIRSIIKFAIANSCILLYFYLSPSLSTSKLYLLYICTCLFNIYAFIFFWNFVSNTLSLKEMKQYVGVISGTNNLGAVFASLLVGPALRYFDLSTCFLGLFIVYILLVLVLIPLKKLELNPKKPSSSSNKTSPQIYKHSLVRLTALFIFLSAFMKFSLDFRYSIAISELFTTQDQLASFIGGFNSVLKASGLIWQMLFSAYVFKRLSIVQSLSVMSICTCILSIFAFLTPNPKLVIAFQFCFLFFLTTFTFPTFNILFGALNDSIQAKARFLNEGIFYCLAVLLSGLLIIALRKFSIPSQTLFLFLTVLSIFWLCFIAKVRDAYISALNENINSNIEGSTETSSVSSLHSLQTDLNHKDPQKRLDAILTLRKTNDNQADRLILDVLKTEQNPQVLNILLKSTKKVRVDSEYKLEDKLDINDTPENICQLLRSISLSKKSSIEPILPFLKHNDPMVKINAILACFILSNDEEHLKEASKLFIHLIQSDNVNEREAAALLFGDLSMDCFIPCLQTMVFDSAPSVRRNAIQSTIKQASSSHIDILKSALNSEKDQKNLDLIHDSLEIQMDESKRILDRLLLKVPTIYQEKVLTAFHKIEDEKIQKLACQYLSIEPHELTIDLIRLIAKNPKDAEFIKIMSACVTTDIIYLDQLVLDIFLSNINEFDHKVLRVIANFLDSKDTQDIIRKVFEQINSTQYSMQNKLRVLQRLLTLDASFPLKESVLENFYKQEDQKVDILEEIIDHSAYPKTVNESIKLVFL
ncbi:MAG: hypothetical protein KC646_02320 [Candidatus Cloacimonetes bacterium]|nr:hypothetical protein [Candidatus Cloacimonadota bacterium]